MLGDQELTDTPMENNMGDGPFSNGTSMSQNTTYWGSQSQLQDPFGQSSFRNSAFFSTLTENPNPPQPSTSTSVNFIDRYDTWFDTTMTGATNDPQMLEPFQDITESHTPGQRTTGESLSAVDGNAPSAQFPVTPDNDAFAYPTPATTNNNLGNVSSMGLGSRGIQQPAIPTNMANPQVSVSSGNTNPATANNRFRDLAWVELGAPITNEPAVLVPRQRNPRPEAAAEAPPPGHWWYRLFGTQLFGDPNEAAGTSSADETDENSTADETDETSTTYNPFPAAQSRSAALQGYFQPRHGQQSTEFGLFHYLIQQQLVAGIPSSGLQVMPDLNCRRQNPRPRLSRIMELYRPEYGYVMEDYPRYNGTVPSIPTNARLAPMQPSPMQPTPTLPMSTQGPEPSNHEDFDVSDRGLMQLESADESIPSLFGIPELESLLQIGSIDLDEMEEDNDGNGNNLDSLFRK
ncbi:hypothetical protein N7532_006677 [Penicillium argentinense]|uniref:Uncharacterized protein n=1 Tax=Penicillium argentinense TaxID=1131581 RepID=A0A9W9KBI2_9EURO|nr:uncharacterized protein N7532_006677 [Penicillium argentinense]KAJ5099676.1 hypothetical protein N7532_006677 [Penicillium argentinense]